MGWDAPGRVEMSGTFGEKSVEVEMIWNEPEVVAVSQDNESRISNM